MRTQLDLPLFGAAPGWAPPPDLRCRRLRLEKRMGAGALGITWRSHLSDGTAVALKLLTVAGPGAREGLERTLPAGHLGRSALLLEVLSAFEEEGRVWVASRLDDGVPLSRLLERGGIRPALAVAVGLDVLGALAYLHERGVWHGAVHARNIHVGRDGSIRLGDYGLASPGGQTGATPRAADVHAAAALIASTLGRGRRSGGSLGLALRAILGSRRLLPAGHEATHARLTLAEGARQAATPGRLELAREQLAQMVAESVSWR